LPEAELPLRQIYGQTSTHGGRRGYATVGEVARAYVKAASERMAWSSDWPHRPNMHTPSPTTRFCPTSWLIGRREAIRNRILVDNPVAPYGFD
jgi:D-galactarolactone isomerase